MDLVFQLPMLYSLQTQVVKSISVMVIGWLQILNLQTALPLTLNGVLARANA